MSLPKTLRVEVTQDDIDKGIGGDPSHCALARAIRRELGDPVDLELSSDELDVNTTELYAGYRVTKRVAAFITRFDAFRGKGDFGSRWKRPKSDVKPGAFRFVRTDLKTQAELKAELDDFVAKYGAG